MVFTICMCGSLLCYCIALLCAYCDRCGFKVLVVVVVVVEQVTVLVEAF